MFSNHLIQCKLADWLSDNEKQEISIQIQRIMELKNFFISKQARCH
jgi:hypothetical protein